MSPTYIGFGGTPCAPQSLILFMVSPHVVHLSITSTDVKLVIFTQTPIGSLFISCVQSIQKLQFLDHMARTMSYNPQDSTQNIETSCMWSKMLGYKHVGKGFHYSGRVVATCVWDPI